MGKKQKFELTEELTTHKSDYKSWPLQHVEACSTRRPRAEAERKPSPPHVRMDHQSHAPYRTDAVVPFNLYIEPKPIVGTDPRDGYQINKPHERKTTRNYSHIPTLFSPTLPMDEIHDEKDLQTILNYTYSGMHKKLMEEAALKPSHPPKPPTKVISEGNNLSYKAVLYSPLPPGWVTASRHWDSLQTRSLGDPFKAFWSRKGPEVECSCCCNPLPHMLSQETKDEIRKLIDEEKLRLPYDVTKIGYGGYKVQCAKGVPLAKS